MVTPEGQKQSLTSKQVLLLIACILYVCSPIDILPDVMPVIGWLDDIAAIVLTARQLTQGGPKGSQGAA